MKKTFAIVLALILALSFAGCNTVTADPGDTTTDGTIGNGSAMGDAMENAGKDVGNAMNDLTDGLTDSTRRYEIRYGSNSNTAGEYTKNTNGYGSTRNNSRNTGSAGMSGTGTTGGSGLTSSVR